MSIHSHSRLPCSEDRPGPLGGAALRSGPRVWACSGRPVRAELVDPLGSEQPHFPPRSVGIWLT